MKFNLCTAVALTLVGLTGAIAQQSEVRVPITGYVADASAKSLRAIQGFPGSAVLGDPLKLAVSVQIAWVSPAADYALVSDGSADAQLFLLSQLSTGTPAVQSLDGVLLNPDLVAFNASGTAAMIYSKAARLTQWVSGLPDRPVAGKPLALAAPAGSITAIALDAAGRTAILGYSDGSRGGILLFDGGSDPQWIATAAKPSAVTYVNHDRDLAFVDSVANQLVLVREVNGARTVLVLAAAADGLVNPIGLRSCNETLVAVSTGAADGSQPASIIQVDLATQRIANMQTLPLTPTRLADLSLRGVFVMNEIGPAPLYLFSASDSSVAFVPARQ